MQYSYYTRVLKLATQERKQISSSGSAGSTVQASSLHALKVRLGKDAAQPGSVEDADAQQAAHLLISPKFVHRAHRDKQDWWQKKRERASSRDSVDVISACC